MACISYRLEPPAGTKLHQGRGGNLVVTPGRNGDISFRLWLQPVLKGFNGHCVRADTKYRVSTTLQQPVLNASEHMSHFLVVVVRYWNTLILVKYWRGIVVNLNMHGLYLEGADRGTSLSLKRALNCLEVWEVHRSKRHLETNAQC